MQLREAPCLISAMQQVQKVELFQKTLQDLKKSQSIHKPRKLVHQTGAVTNQQQWC